MVLLSMGLLFFFVIRERETKMVGSISVLVVFKDIFYTWLYLIFFLLCLDPTFFVLVSHFLVLIIFWPPPTAKGRSRWQLDERLQTLIIIFLLSFSSLQVEALFTVGSFDAIYHIY